MKDKPLLEILSSNKFYLNIGLYEEIEIENSELSSDRAISILYAPSNLDCRCIECEKDSIFQYIATTPLQEDHFRGRGGLFINKDSVNWLKEFEKLNEIFTVQFKCSRKDSHILTFIVQVKNCKISKVGQSSSFADLQAANIKEYEKILGPTYYKEFKTAIGLFSHGIGVGAFVYLRRIIEQFVIQPAYEEVRNHSDWNDSVYQNSKVKEKISLLRVALPGFLVSNPVLYSVISKGIHELTDNECKEYFPVLKACLEEVLSDLHAKRQKEIKRAEMQKALSNIASKIS